MKAYSYSRTRNITNLLALAFVIFSPNFAISQIARTSIAKFINQNSVSSSKLFSFDEESSGYHRFGIGLQTNPVENPAAVFHIKDYIFTARPVFKIDGKNTGGTVIGSVKFLFTDSVKYYGIHQTGNTSFYNYFQNPMGIGAPAVQNFMLNVGGPARIFLTVYG